MPSLTTTLLIALAFTSQTVLADFHIGNCASSDLDGNSQEKDAKGIALPGSQLDCNYKAVPDGSDICTAQQEIRTLNDGGVCPGNNEDRSLNFCGITLTGSGCPASYQLGSSSISIEHAQRQLMTDRLTDPRDDCGDVALRRDDLAEDGYFYAGLIDTNNNNIAVGRCVYEVAQNGTQTCPMADSPDLQSQCATFIKCYTTMYGNTKC